ncbi:MAG: long-chain-acyl-CoA synthetase [Myxococcota bacterium]
MSDFGPLQELAARASDARGLARIVTRAPYFLPGRKWNLARLLEERAETHPGVLGLAFEDRRYTWPEMDRAVNRRAHALRDQGVNAGDSVVLLMDNRPEFVFNLLACSRLRATPALINTNISGSGLVHALEITKPVKAIIGSEHLDKVREVLPELTSLTAGDLLVDADAGDPAPGDLPSFDGLIELASEAAARSEEPRVEDRACYIYTSGTTGLPKAAIVTNQRILMAGTMFSRGFFEAGPNDVIYVTLPLYHSNGMFAGVASSLITGATMALRRKFSASRFWEDVRRFDATCFIYIGELCRYLLNQPDDPRDGEHRLRVIAGNGLRPDIWERFQQRFQIPMIREFYGATEGTTPVANFAGRPGMVGRLLPGQAVLRCEQDTGELLRDANGLCAKVAAGETGLLVTPINQTSKFDGYLDESASKKKIMEDVLKKGDCYFNTGDLLTLHAYGWLSFADRVGDTFRWKGENVSTNEVAEVLNGAPGVQESNVFGVQIPGADGRAGMAALNVGEDFSLDDFAAYVVEKLPGYQRPYFVRLLEEMQITGTFKHQKVDYRRQGYDPSQVTDPLYFLDGEKFVPVDGALYAGIQSGEVTLR